MINYYKNEGESNEVREKQINLWHEKSCKTKWNWNYRSYSD